MPITLVYWRNQVFIHFWASQNDRIIPILTEKQRNWAKIAKMAHFENVISNSISSLRHLPWLYTPTATSEDHSEKKLCMCDISEYIKIAFFLPT